MIATSVQGLLAERRGELDAAALLFSAAAEQWRGFSMPYEEAQALLGQGRCLVVLGSSHRATEVLDRSRRIFSRLGARPALAEALSWLVEAGWQGGGDGS